MKISRHRAGWVMITPENWLADGIVTLAGDRVSAVDRAGKEASREDLVDHGPGVIMPGLVNAHTHITLSGLAGEISTGRGFFPWIQDLMKARKKIKKGKGAVEAEKAIQEMKKGGVGAVGEFGPYFPVAGFIADASMEGIVWLEFFGNRRRLPALPRPVGGVDFSYAGHAPNTASPELLKLIKEKDRQMNKRFCLHLAESSEEVEFLALGKGPWADFLKRAGLDFSRWNCWGKRPVGLAEELGLLDRDTLAVHLVQVNREEISVLAEKGTNVCLCPRSNLNLHGRLPDIQGFLETGIMPALGTDSLASTESLSVFDEMRFVAQNYPGISPHAILEMGTVNGAKALGLKDAGWIRSGSRAKLIYVDIDIANPVRGTEELVNTEIKRVEWL